MFHGVDPLEMVGILVGAIFAAKVLILELIDAAETIKERLARYKAS